MILVSLDSDQTSHAAQASTIQHPIISNEGHIYDTFNQWVRMEGSDRGVVQGVIRSYKPIVRII